MGAAATALVLVNVVTRIGGLLDADRGSDDDPALTDVRKGDVDCPADEAATAVFR